MSVLRTHAASTMLGVSPNTLRSWERRFGYPTPLRTSGGHRQYDLSEVEALRQAFEETHNVSSAISIARERGSGPSSPTRLRSALRRFDELEADRILEESLAVRSVERTVDEVLLPAIGGLCGPAGETPSAELGFAWRWANGWLAAAKRVAPPPTRAEGVLIFDASGPADIDALHAQALELCLRRTGVRSLTLTAELDASRLAHVLRALTPQVVVLTGRRAWLDALSRIAYLSRHSVDPVDVVDFRGALEESDAESVPRLGTSALGARDLLLARLNDRDSGVRGRAPLIQAL
ncbi:MAG: MerR family transcriptional regulator, light-induced transcriptional regulator [Solirubrobacteraceae bacterium]|nr:MerR family transcriptional regulator, light-induced transcriptional regulator [Solirubrobacteraceae bacterium]